jgi:hypothetical protein
MLENTLQEKPPRRGKTPTPPHNSLHIAFPLHIK